MKRPDLNEVPLKATMLGTRMPSVNITMSEGQWDGLLQAAYEAGHNLIVLGENEIPLRAYRKKMDAWGTTKVKEC